MPYYPYTGGNVRFIQRVGLIPPAQKLLIKKARQASPRRQTSATISLTDRVRSSRSLICLDNDTLFATPIGVIQGQQEHYLL